MAVNVDTPDVPKLMVGALSLAAVLFCFIVVVNHVHAKAGVGVAVQ